MAFTSSYTPGLIQQSEYYYGTPEMTPGLSGSFSGSFQGDGSQLTNLPSTDPFPYTGDAQITGSLNLSGSLNIRVPEGSPFNITETDYSVPSRFNFSFTDGNPLLQIQGRLSASRFELKRDNTTTSFQDDGQVFVKDHQSEFTGSVKFIPGGIQAVTTTSGNQNFWPQIGSSGRPFYYYYMSPIGGQFLAQGTYSTIKYILNSAATGYQRSDGLYNKSSGMRIIVSGSEVGGSTGYLRNPSNVYLQIQDDSTGTGNNSSIPFRIAKSGSIAINLNQSKGTGFNQYGIPDAMVHVEAEPNFALDLFRGNDVNGNSVFNVDRTGHITASGNISASATSTASFGTYIGDGSQLTGLISSSYAVTASHALNVTTPTLQEVTTAGNTTNQGLIVTGSTTFKPISSGNGGAIELTNIGYSGLDNPIMTFKDGQGNSNVVIGHRANDGQIQIYDQPDSLRTVLSANFSAFNPGSTTGNGTYFGLTSSMAPTSTNGRAYIKMYETSYSGAPAYNFQLNNRNYAAGSGTIGLYGIMSTTSTAAPAIQITSINSDKVVNFGGPSFIHSNGKQNNYLKYGLQIGGGFTGTNANMPLTDGSLIMSGSGGLFSIKSVSSEAEIKTNNGATTLTLGTTSSFTAVSASSYISASKFIGDGSGLTNLPVSDPFPHTASSAAIISRSIASGDTDSTALRLFGSGSISESGIFEVEGSAGPLFSVQDGLDGVLMEVNNITGLPLFQVSSSNEVFINRGNLTSGVTTATASFAHFTGSFQGDGSQLTNLPSYKSIPIHRRCSNNRFINSIRIKYIWFRS